MKPARPVDIFSLLRARYEPPAWAFLDEVRNGTGLGRVVRTADAMAMSLFPSRGLHLHGFEIKVSRADWLKELKAPEKAEEMARFCHYWHLVVNDVDIVKPGELPQPWGLLVRKGDKLVVAAQPTFNEHATPPTYRFLGALLRKFSATETAQAKIDEAWKRGREDGWTAGMGHAQTVSDAGRTQAALDELRARVETFEKASGVSLDRYQLGNVAAAVRVLAGGYDSPIKRLKHLAKDADEIAKASREAVETFGPLATTEET